jgi:hypothetical protein
MIKKNWLLVPCLLVFVGTSAGRAEAQTTPAGDDDLRQSAALFEEARRMVDAGNCPGAVPGLRESLRLHPSIGAHLSLAQCLATDDAFTAWRELKVAERLAVQKGDARANYARAKAEALQPRLPLIRVHTVPDVAGLEVKVDGAAVEQWDGVIAVSPGDHVVEIRGREKKTASRPVRASTGEVTDVTVTLEDDGPRPVDERKNDAGAPQRTVGIAVGAVGIAALAVGSIAGVVALVKKGDLKDQCTPPGADPNEAFSKCGAPARDSVNSELDTTHTWATVATIGFIAGFAAVAAGAAIYLSAPSSKRATALRLGPGSAVVEGRF